MAIVMGTAGHIDHGKTSLVKALTGTDCDRLAEEKKRGITIELGFAHLERPDGERISIIDVPGHERFVKNMVSGTAGIDFVMLVIAADEGIMPQTREHLEICSLLGIKRGLVAITKADTVEETWLALVTEDIRNFLHGTFLESAPMLHVSSHVGKGIPELKEIIFNMADNYQPERRADIPRLPIDRVFTVKGYGTVVTGTLISGVLELGEEIEIYPLGKTSKIRLIQSHGASEKVAMPGHRTAINIPALDVYEIEKGSVLSLPDRLFPTNSWIIHLRCLESSPLPIKNRTELHFHHGSKEQMAKVLFLDRTQLLPGESAICQVKFTEKMPGMFGDHFVVRSFSPLQAIGGGQVLLPFDKELKRKSKNFAENMTQILRLAELVTPKSESKGAASTKEANNVLTETILTQMALAGVAGATFRHISVMANGDDSTIAAVLDKLVTQEKLSLVNKEDQLFIAENYIQELCQSCAEWVTNFHAAEPLKPGISRNALASGWGRALPVKTSLFIVEKLLLSGELSVDGDVLRLKTHQAVLAGNSKDISDKILAIYDKGGLTPPNLNEVLEELSLTPKEAAPVIKLLVTSKQLFKICESIYYSANAHASLIAGLKEWFATHKELTSTEYRDFTGLSRKYSAALLEYFDRERITLRLGQIRTLLLKQ